MEPARLRASPEQFSALVEFMERHGDLSRPQAGAQGRIRSDQLWSQCSTLLNSIGGGVEKSQDKWKKVWSDWKTKTKKKSQLIRLHASGTGGGPSSRLTLTALEERVVAILGVTAVAGQSSIEEQGFSAPSQPSVQQSQPQLVLEVEVPDVHSPLLIPSPPGPLAPAQGPLEPAPGPLAPAPGEAISTPLPLPPPPSPPPTSPPLWNRHQPASPPSAAGSPRRRLLRARRNRGLTPFERATHEFVAVEQRRLRFEETRETMLHERETERLRLEAQRIEITHDHNRLLQQLGVVAQNLLNTITQNRSSSLPSTDILPDTE